MDGLRFRLQTVLRTLVYRPWLNVVMLVTLMVAFFLPLSHLAWRVYFKEALFENQSYLGHGQLVASLPAGSTSRIKEAFAQEGIPLDHLDGMAIRTPLSWEGELFMAHIVGHDQKTLQEHIPLLRGCYPESESLQNGSEALVTLDLSQKMNVHIGDEINIRGKTAKVVGYTSLPYMVPSVVSTLSEVESWYEGEMLSYTVLFEDEDMEKVQTLWTHHFSEEPTRPRFMDAQGWAEEKIRERDMTEAFHLKELGASLALSVLAIVMIYMGYALQKKRFWGILRTLGATKWQMLGDMVLELFIYAAAAVLLDYVVLSLTDRYMVWIMPLHIKPVILCPAMGLALAMALLTATISWIPLSKEMPATLLQR